jgi:phage tail tube protein FII
MAGLKFLPVRGCNVFADGINVGIINTGAKLPLLSETGESITFGGSRGAVEIMTSADACEVMFSMKGIAPDIMAQWGAGFGVRKTYTVLAALVDEYSLDASKRVVQLQATAIGRLSSVDTEKFEGGALPGTEVGIKSITKYLLRIGGQEVARYDLALGGWLDTGGVQTEIAAAIGLTV